MELGNKFKRAEKIISKLNPEEQEILEKICKEIRRAEDELIKEAEDTEIMSRCIKVCKGLCCRNIQPDLFSLWDFIFISATEKSMANKISKCLEKEKSIFSCDCIFLENGQGPCIFPHSSKPEMCVTTFCGDDTPIKKEINLVKSKFIKLCWFIMLRKPRALKRFFVRNFSKKQNTPNS